ncbi:hypothetical protein K435DRAFT_779340 [Dendrothele bispora CBS 962.96]|uniref:Protein-S-isoprenylcysteine O-methyltransferase n=1 Tax=Dendrothele bispora (strain CBS 962.96) TaxID=1314807 RepID=A0A4S8LZA6_DENBC|nr:hypothetical protein K435DRAFT_779340 [Dendrothele bispora CBS 962.96]
MTPPNARPADDELESRRAEVQDKANNKTDLKDLPVQHGADQGSNMNERLRENSRTSILGSRRMHLLANFIPPVSKAHGHWIVFGLFHLFFFIEVVLSLALFLADSNPLKKLIIDYFVPYHVPVQLLVPIASEQNNAFSGQSEYDLIPWQSKAIYIRHVLQPSPQLILGATMTLMGGLIRRASYKAMKELFTFQLSIRKEHRLVTSGPYAYVRHPSYTGALLAGSGAILSLVLGRGSWFRECLWQVITMKFRGFHSYRLLVQVVHFPPPPRSDDIDIDVVVVDGRLDLCNSLDLALTLTVLVLAVFLARVVFVPRMKKEDEMMEREFGAEWRSWKGRARCRMVPGVY